MTKGIAVGIDTGTHTGFAVFDRDTGQLTRLVTFQLWEALKEVALLAGTCRQAGRPFLVCFEDARQRKWYNDKGLDASRNRGRAMGAASVKRDAVIWEEFLTKNAIPYEAVKPRKGATKYSAEQFARITGWTARTSEHARDAAMLILNFCNNG